MEHIEAERKSKEELDLHTNLGLSFPILEMGE